jgi:predicted nucleic acid-binding protein
MIDATHVSGPRGQAAREAIGGLAVSERLASSALVDLECMVRPIRSGDAQQINSIRTALATFRHLDITEQVFELATHMRAIHRFTTPDALHIATASLGGCDAFWTRDRRLLSALPDFALNPCADL